MLLECPARSERRTTLLEVGSAFRLHSPLRELLAFVFVFYLRCFAVDLASRFLRQCFGFPLSVSLPALDVMGEEATVVLAVAHPVGPWSLANRLALPIVR